MEYKYKIKYFGPFRSFIGLMFQIPEKNAIYILDLKEDVKDGFVHTFFCLKPLDIYLFNSKLELIDFRKKLKPFKIIIPKRPFRFIIEGLDINEDKINFSLDYLKSSKII
ncbi:MAG: hypothetical protein ACP5GJ_00925 [Nanopusillaceae archaeon]